MLNRLFRKVFGSRNERLVKRMTRLVAQINVLEPGIQALSDDALRAKTDEFRTRLQQGEALDSLLNEAFAVVREAGRRVLEMRHFDVQLIGGMVLHQGKISEMRTGEGKTLVATLPVYFNALSGKGVHVVTVNDYLARRDAEWMGRIYHFLGLTIGVINSSGGMGPDTASYQFDPSYVDPTGYRHLRPVTRRQAYACDVTYGTNNEFGFDYLRDNMAFSAEQRVQRRNYAIVDEVDSILIDEARTPLIISGPSDESSQLYAEINKIIPRLTRQAPITNEEGKPDFGPGDFSVDEKARQTFLSDEGHEHVEEALMELGLLDAGSSLYDSSNIILMHHVNAALRAHALFRRDVDYIVRDGQIIIVDEFTGRTMPGRRWSDGLHQAVEAKEGVPIQAENQTLASITFQNYFRLYDKLAGMTGTADTEAYEFQQIYGLEVVVIPTNQPMIRDDQSDLVYLTQREKFDAILADIKDCIQRGQPVLVGTASIEVSEHVAQLLNQDGIAHQVLNAKQHEREAKVVAQAGRPGTVTIATNMAGRGTDIVLGGSLDSVLQELGDNPDPAAVAQVREEWKESHRRVVEAGGLRVVGTERHESRRIDNQLRGRSGRQGDPGSSRFYLSLEDNLMRIFASERVSTLMQKLGMQEGEAIEHPWVNKAIENAQRKVEGRNFDIRKQLLEYDDVANDQRKVIYRQRDELMDTEDVSETIRAIRSRRGERRHRHLRAAREHRGPVEHPGPRGGAGRVSRPAPAAAALAGGGLLAARGDPARAHPQGPRGQSRREGGAGRAGGHAAVREGRDAADAGPPLEGAPGGDGLPAPGHSPARLRAEEPEAGVQARGLRDVRAHARRHQAGGGLDDRARAGARPAPADRDPRGSDRRLPVHARGVPRLCRRLAAGAG